MTVYILHLQVKVQGQYEEMLLAACEQFLGKSEAEIQQVALETLEGHQRAIMGSMSVEVSVFFVWIYKIAVLFFCINFLHLRRKET